MFDKVLALIGFAMLVGMAMLTSYAIAHAVFVGEVKTVAKSGSGVLYMLSANPVGFVSALLPQMLLSGVFWFAAYWIWMNRVRKNG